MFRLTLLCLFLCSTSVMASNVDGTFEENSDGTLNIDVNDGYHELYGSGEELDDNTLSVNLRNNDGGYYVGRATRNLNGGYTLDLKSETDDDVATGYIYDH